jgi:hypothetical protein
LLLACVSGRTSGPSWRQPDRRSGASVERRHLKENAKRAAAETACRFPAFAFECLTREPRQTKPPFDAATVRQDHAHLHFMTISRPIPKFMALILVSTVIAFIAISADTSILAKIDAMSATEYVEYQRKLYHHSFLHHFVLVLVVGGLYVAGVEFIAFVISLVVRKPAARTEALP